MPGVVRMDGTGYVNHGDCIHRCPQGNPCACKGTPHSLHVCDDVDCECHAQERYRLAGGAIAYTRTTLRRGGVRVVLDQCAPGGVGWVAVDRYEDAPSSN